MIFITPQRGQRGACGIDQIDQGKMVIHDKRAKVMGLMVVVYHPCHGQAWTIATINVVAMYSLQSSDWILRLYLEVITCLFLTLKLST